MTDFVSSSDGAHAHAPDPHGQAAMLLVESLIHGLIERSVISVADAIEIVAVATEVEEGIAEDLGQSPEAARASLSLLNAIAQSLGGDLPRDGGQPILKVVPPSDADS